MNFVKSLSLLVDLKSDSYDIILVIVNCLTKMVYYKSLKPTIDIAGQAKIIIDMVIRYYSLSELIISNRR